MKARICVLALTLALAGAWSASALAQVGAVFVPDMASSGNNGTPFLQRLHNSNFPALFWFSFTGTDENVGFLGSYGTVGVKSRLGDSDVFGGRWLFEGRAHVSAKSGRFFSNLGVERVFTVAPANSDISFGVWWDWDNDKLPNSTQTYQQVGFSAKLKTPNFDLIANLYKPVRDKEILFGTPEASSNM